MLVSALKMSIARHSPRERRSSAIATSFMRPDGGFAHSGLRGERVDAVV
jgi:hypothetical protein